MLSLALQRRAPVRPVATLVLLPSLGQTARMWHPFLEQLGRPGAPSDPVEVWAFDVPGHGTAPAIAESAAGGAFELADLAAELVPMLENTPDDVPVVAVGVSMGGAVALELAARSPRVAGVACLNSALRFGTAEGWGDIVAATRAAGSAAFDPDGTRAGWFTPGFASGRGADLVRAALEDLADVDAASYIACCEALARYDGTATAAAVTVPGIAVGGRADRATPPEAMARLAASRPLFSYAELPGAHLAVIEDAREAADLVAGLVRRVAGGGGPAAPAGTAPSTSDHRSPTTDR